MTGKVKVELRPEHDSPGPPTPACVRIRGAPPVQGVRWLRHRGPHCARRAESVLCGLLPGLPNEATALRPGRPECRVSACELIGWPPLARFAGATTRRCMRRQAARFTARLAPGAMPPPSSRPKPAQATKP